MIKNIYKLNTKHWQQRERAEGEGRTRRRGAGGAARRPVKRERVRGENARKYL